ncbi:MAG: glycosyltransferase family 4 protein [Deferribacterota bacterium]|nr:glycosyltransferase family 4 protein [Deferribacterota bacterium]
MKILYVSKAQIPSNMASSIQIMKMCEAFAENGHDVTLLIPSKKNREYANMEEDIYKFYNVKKIFKVKKFPPIKFPLKILTNDISYALLCLKYAKRFNYDLIYSRDIISSTLLAYFGFSVRIELHNKLPKRKQRFFFNLLKRSKNLKKIIFISNKLKEYYLNNYKIDKNNIIVAPSAASIPTTLKRKNLSVKYSGILQVGYIGNLYVGKGIELIIKLASKMPEIDFHIVGGTKKEVNFWRNKTNSTNIYFHGFINQTNISDYINAMDVCLLPNQKIVISSVFKNNGEETYLENFGDITSPLKMFQYMAHKKPIVASDLPVIREVLNENNAILSPPDNIDKWVDAINILKDKNLRSLIANRAYNDFIKKYTWDIRAKKVLL